MAKKYTVSVPDALAARIDAGREVLGNLSAVFQQAVEEKLNKREEFEKRLKGDDAMDAIVERLKSEKVKAEQDYKEMGHDDGLNWAKAASYVDLRHAATKFEPYVGGSNQYLFFETLLEDKVLGEYFEEMIREDPLMDELNPDTNINNFLNEYAELWIDGWMEAVRGFWYEVADKL
ncbi:hypothetical protein ACFL2Q_15020 [Thermodesulfobacteriota bacterium]